MAITGKGTETEPWLVHSYDEIKTCFDKDKPEDADKQSSTYIKLANDIDCNDYGDGWKWKTIKNGDISNGRTTFFDLNGHTIKNVMIKSGNGLFYAANDNNAHNVMVMNGKLLNIFTEGTTSIFKGTSLKKLSISVDTSPTTEQAFNGCYIEMCSIYVSTSKVLSSGGIFRFRRQNGYYAINSDFWLDITDINQVTIWSVNGGDSSRCPATDCRFRGNIGGTMSFTTYNDQRYSTLFGEKAERCVADVAFKGSVADMGQLNVFSSNNEPITSIFNVDKFKGTYAYSIAAANVIACSDKEMKSYEELIKKGFSVVKVGD